MDGINGLLMRTYVGSCYVDTSEDSIGTYNINIEISFTHNKHRQTMTPEYKLIKTPMHCFALARGNWIVPQQR
jgi:hypothetical protein